MTVPNPYISFVTVSRNDDHGGNPLGRTQTFLNSLYRQCNLYKIPSELIIVEWNPPEDRKRLEEVLDFPEDEGYLTARIIEVPKELHNKFAHSDSMPLFQMIGKNVGIKRAKGEYILSTNIDILFSDSLMKFISERSLRPNHSYRLDRKDIGPKGQIIRINKKYGTYNYRTLKEKIISWMHHTKDEAFRKSEFKRYGYPLIHTNACGDFTLMAKENWMSLRGYVELELYSFHIDSLLLLAAYYSGMVEIYLTSPDEIQHIEHGTGSGWTPGEGEMQLYDRLHTDRIPYLTWNDCRKYASDMRSMRYLSNGVVKLNTSDLWGLSEYILNETIIG